MFCITRRGVETFYLIVFFTLFFLFERFTAQEKEIEAAKTAQYQSELKSLKAQIHPHFIFNTLNAIYSHAIVENLDSKFSNLIFQFSDILKYVVYEGQVKEVALSRELEIIESYITLQSFRHEEHVIVQYTSEITNNRLYIAPLLLITFIENAFKHTGNLTGEQHPITIEIREHSNVLHFYCKNPYAGKNDDILSSIRETESSENGIGLENTKKRLDILYPEKHHLHITKEASFFSVRLQIHLL